MHLFPKKPIQSFLNAAGVEDFSRGITSRSGIMR